MKIVKRATEGVAQLGCSPCTLGVGIGRSHFEASAMMLQALTDGRYDQQSEMEQEITRRVNEANIGPLGLRGGYERAHYLYEGWPPACQRCSNRLRSSNLLL